MNLAFIQKRKYKNGNPSFGLSELCSTSIAQALGATILTKVIRPKLGKYSILINWGISSIPWLSRYHSNWMKSNKVSTEVLYVLNPPDTIKNAVNKIKTFQLFEENEVPSPRFTTSIEEAKAWFTDNPKVQVFCRTFHSSCQGKGIVIASLPEEIVTAPLYTIRIPKKWEYRVHVICDDVIRVQQKKKLSGNKLEERGIKDETNGLIRSYNNGYIFSTELTHSEGTEIYTLLCDVAIRAVSSLGLDFGAVDLLVTKKGEVYALEVNTAPGIEGATKSDYINKFKQIFGI